MPGKDRFERRKAYQKAWHAYIAGGEPEKGLVANEILESWRRSRDHGVDPDGTGFTEILGGPDLEKRLSDSTALLDVARPFMRSIHSIVGADQFVVRITDHEGYVLEIIGGETARTTGRTLGVVPGANVSESLIGTNAIGLSLVTGRAIQVMGAEHYRRIYHEWTTSAAPIVGGDDRVLGVISISGHYEKVHPHTLGMALASAEAIGHELALITANRNLARAHEHSLAMMEAMKEGILCIDERGVIRDINGVARRMMGHPKKNLAGTPLSHLLKGESLAALTKAFGGKDKIEETEMTFHTKSGRRLNLLVTFTPLEHADQPYREAVLTLREAKNVHHLINRLAGTGAIYTFDDILGRSRPILDALRLASHASDSEATVLILGESGTGKELFAQSIHNASPRQNRPFVFLNCGAIPRDLVASELFGYVEGAFTGAKRGGHPGKFELADGGTLFLDEIGDMPLDTQATLLRVLETKELMRVGGHEVIPVDVRVIAATNKDLQEEVRRGNFRGDLFYRLNVVMLQIPPLRERPGDLMLLVEAILKKAGAGDIDLSESFLQKLSLHDWPGNVRELQNILQQSLHLLGGGDKLEDRHLPPHLLESVREETGFIEAVETDLSLETVERRVIERTVAAHRDNLTEAARILGISRTTLYRKLEKYHLKHLMR